MGLWGKLGIEMEKFMLLMIEIDLKVAETKEW